MDNQRRYNWFNFPVINVYPIVSYSLIISFILVFMLELYLSSSFLKVDNYVLIAMGSLQKGIVFSENEFFRTLSSSFLHGSYLHLIFNSLAMYYIGMLLERLLGFGYFLFSYLICCLGSSLFSIYLFDSQIQSVGASGGIMGVLALLITISFRIPKGADRKKLHVQFGYWLVPSLLPIIPGVDYTAHWGGAITGFLIGLIYLFSWKKLNFNKFNQMILAAFSILIIISIGYLTFNKYEKYSYLSLMPKVLPTKLISNLHTYNSIELEKTRLEYPDDPLVLYQKAIKEINNEDSQEIVSYLDHALNQEGILKNFYKPILKLQIQILYFEQKSDSRDDPALQLLKNDICKHDQGQSIKMNENILQRINRICTAQ